MSSKVESLVQEFVANLRQAIAEDAAEMFRLAAGGAAPRKPGPKPKGIAVSASTPKANAPKRKGGKRTSEEIEAQAATVLSYIKKNPQHGAEQIGAALGMTTSELALPIKSLLAKKSLKTVGQKRGTKYSVK
jgi:predicted HTH transcriptional regulator